MHITYHLFIHPFIYFLFINYINFSSRRLLFLSFPFPFLVFLFKNFVLFMEVLGIEGRINFWEQNKGVQEAPLKKELRQEWMLSSCMAWEPAWWWVEVRDFRHQEGGRHSAPPGLLRYGKAAVKKKTCSLGPRLQPWYIKWYKALWHAECGETSVFRFHPANQSGPDEHLTSAVTQSPVLRKMLCEV